MTISPQSTGLARPSAEELGFRLLSGRVALDFTATLGERWRRRFERLASPPDLARWLRVSGVLQGSAIVSQDGLEEARRLRESIYRVAQAKIAGSRVGTGEVRLINEHALHPDPAPQLKGSRLVWVIDQPLQAALSVIARDAIELFASPLADRIRECESAECALLFVDTSRPGQRRWCSSETCGSRARSAAYRARR